jgi:hypothetical protein
MALDLVSAAASFPEVRSALGVGWDWVKKRFFAPRSNGSQVPLSVRTGIEFKSKTGNHLKILVVYQRGEKRISSKTEPAPGLDLPPVNGRLESDSNKTREPSPTEIFGLTYRPA